MVSKGCGKVGIIGSGHAAFGAGSGAEMSSTRISDNTLLALTHSRACAPELDPGEGRADKERTQLHELSALAFTLRQLQYFIAVAEKGTISGAAQTLSISQSAVTEAIKELEQDLGVALFERHRRGI